MRERRRTCTPRERIKGKGKRGNNRRGETERRDGWKKDGERGRDDMAAWDRDLSR